MKMVIIHCVPKKLWDAYAKKDFYGNESIEDCGFIHCSEVSAYPFVAPNFKNTKEDLLILAIDTNKVKPEIKWEDLEDCGTKYPHIYGLLNKDAILDVLPHLWNDDRTWVVNKEFKNYEI